MGISGSKPTQEVKKEATTGSVPTTPILTPKVKKNIQEISDPRSPSCSILRTPITASSPLTPASSDKCDTFNINSPGVVKNLDDPRSPSVAFTRTPITAVEEVDLLKRVQLRNLHSIKKVISDMPSQVPPKLLESSPIKPRENERRKSVAGLLETNIDYIETDLDSVVLSKSSPSSVKYVSPSKSELKAKFLENVQKEEKETELICQLSDAVISSTPVQEDLATETDDSQSKPPQHLVDDDGLIIKVSSPEAVAVLEDVECTPKKEIITTTVQEFEKKVSHLIYTEDEHISSTPPVNKHILLTKTTNRTPLGTRNGNNAQEVVKNKPKLRVSDKPRRADYVVSKIPVFNTKNKAECENTPPRNMLEARKGRRAQWDSDNTLII